MAKRGRNSKYTEENLAEIKRVLEGGGTIKDACAAAGITSETYFQYQKLADFSDMTTRAQAVARQHAVAAIRLGVIGTQSETEDVQIVSETRFRKVKITSDDGKAVWIEQPYEYQKSTKRKIVTHIPPDWRAAVEYLKRRAKDDWSEKTLIEISGGLDIALINQAIKAITEAGLDASEVFNELIAKAPRKVESS